MSQSFGVPATAEERFNQLLAAQTSLEGTVLDVKAQVEELVKTEQRGQEQVGEVVLQVQRGQEQVREVVRQVTDVQVRVDELARVQESIVSIIRSSPCN